MRSPIPLHTAVYDRESSRTGRVEKRVHHRAPCRLRSLESGGSFAALGETINLSDTGLSVQVGRDVQQGTRVEVLLPYMDGEPTCLYGEVVHSRRVVSGTYEVGIWITAPARP